MIIHTHTCIYIESYGGISIVGAVFPALYTRVYYGYAREKERGGGKGSLSMLTTCRVIFFIISACLFYICIKRKCLRTRVPPRDNVGGLCWLLPPPPPRSNRLNRVRGCSSLLVAGRWTGRDLVARKERLLFIPDPLGRDLLFQTAPRGGVEWNRLFGIWGRKVCIVIFLHIVVNMINTYTQII